MANAESSATALPARGSRISFLYLPSEIRNRIYSFVLDDSSNAPKQPEEWPQGYCNPLTGSFRGFTTDWKLSQILWRGLSQSCRRLRAEFRSMQSGREIYIKLCDLYSYLRLLVLEAGLEFNSSNLAAVRRDIEVRISGAKTVELYDAVMLLRRAPNVQVDFYGLWSDDYIPLPPRLFEPKFIEYVAGHVDRITVPTGGMLHHRTRVEPIMEPCVVYEVKLYMKPDSQAPWMKDITRYPWEWSAWKRTFGATPSQAFIPIIETRGTDDSRASRPRWARRRRRIKDKGTTASNDETLWLPRVT